MKEQRVCHCGKRFTIRRSDEKYCSALCRRVVYEQRLQGPRQSPGAVTLTSRTPILDAARALIAAGASPEDTLTVTGETAYPLGAASRLMTCCIRPPP
jgi:hypothetical protein